MQRLCSPHRLPSHQELLLLIWEHFSFISQSQQQLVGTCHRKSSPANLHWVGALCSGWIHPIVLEVDVFCLGDRGDLQHPSIWSGETGRRIGMIARVNSFSEGVHTLFPKNMERPAFFEGLVCTSAIRVSPGPWPEQV